MLRGFKTVLFGAAVAVAPALLDFTGAVDWQSLGMSPGMGAAVGSAIVALRAMTSTPIGRA